MCCDGTMFELVQLQPADSRKELAALALKLKRKHGATCFQQPCSAFRGSHCAVYAQRPVRCRVFECRQLQRVTTGDSTEREALEKIAAARNQAAHVAALLLKLGEKPSRRRLKQRCDDALAQPSAVFENPESATILALLSQAIGALEALLDEHFRPAPEPPEDPMMVSVPR